MILIAVTKAYKSRITRFPKPIKEQSSNFGNNVSTPDGNMNNLNILFLRNSVKTVRLFALLLIQIKAN